MATSQSLYMEKKGIFHWYFFSMHFTLTLPNLARLSDTGHADLGLPPQHQHT